MVSVPFPQIHTWTRDEYHRMADMGLFLNRRVELIEGQILDMAAMKSPHAVAIDLVDAALQSVFANGYYIRQQKPLVLGDRSEPEPDIAVVSGTIRDYATAHPRMAVLVVEVADSSLTYDRTTKVSLYAKAGIPDYWILNLVNHHLEVYRHPAATVGPDAGWGYRQRTLYSADTQVVPLGTGAGAIAVADLLP
ncbi:MAG: Uma2 family endonuclease [Leptolyngbya sp.]|nr:Uma2 family endonuclease [Leptolyngbya sp.]